MTETDIYRVPSWHAQHPESTEKHPLCGTLSARGGPTWRVATTTKVTCKKCLRALEKKAANCGCQLGTCESKPQGCRMAEEVRTRDQRAM